MTGFTQVKQHLNGTFPYQTSLSQHLLVYTFVINYRLTSSSTKRVFLTDFGKFMITLKLFEKLWEYVLFGYEDSFFRNLYLMTIN